MEQFCATEGTLNTSNFKKKKSKQFRPWSALFAYDPFTGKNGLKIKSSMLVYYNISTCDIVIVVVLLKVI